jgi:MGT family glycosyltransferase
MTDSIVVICIPAVGHVHALLPVIERLRARGRAVYVMTGADMQPTVERTGAQFIDLFERYPLDEADATSEPKPSRYVSFAGVYAERLADDVAALSPGLIVYDTFSVVAPVIALRLGVPYVNVCANHDGVPARTVAALREDPRVATSPECWAAVERLREVHGMSDANPFSYVEAFSPFLNIYPEPPEFLPERDRAAFEPVAFFGVLAPGLRDNHGAQGFRTRGDRRRLLVSFGTIIWRYFEAEALAVLGAISTACADLDIEVVISLGGSRPEASARASLARSNVDVRDHVDQWALLGEADVFVTHHGINSTHEAIFHEVPMISYPFFGDQPDLARRCQELGLAVPLTAKPRAAVAPGAVRSALACLEEERADFEARLAVARSWELRTMAARDEALDRILRLADRRPGQDSNLRPTP